MPTAAAGGNIRGTSKRKNPLPLPLMLLQRLSLFPLPCPRRLYLDPRLIAKEERRDEKGMDEEEKGRRLKPGAKKRVQEEDSFALSTFTPLFCLTD